MATARDVLGNKGRQVVSIGPKATALDAAVLMNDHRVGALVVLDGGDVQGIFTERDVLRRIVATQADAASMTVESVMTRDVVCCDPEAKIDDVRRVFMNQRIRHLPVVEKSGALLGMLSIGDLNAWRLDDQAVEIHYLEEFLYGNA